MRWKREAQIKVDKFYSRLIDSSLVKQSWQELCILFSGMRWQELRNLLATLRSVKSSLVSRACFVCLLPSSEFFMRFAKTSFIRLNLTKLLYFIYSTKTWKLVRRLNLLIVGDVVSVLAPPLEWLRFPTFSNNDKNESPTKSNHKSPTLSLGTTQISLFVSARRITFYEEHQRNL